MQARTVRIWYRTHKWSSLICTAFMLMLCLTGLPLIFHSEIDAWLETNAPPPLTSMPPDTPTLSLDAIVNSVQQRYPTEYIHWVSPDKETPAVWIGTGPDGPEPGPGRTFRIDSRSGEVFELADNSGKKPSWGQRAMRVMHDLHTDLFLEFPGEILLCVMGILFVIATVTGLLLYGPFMRKLDFGTFRAAGASRTKWFDLHNLIGIVTLVWALVVGFTGAFNTLSEVMLGQWQATTVQSVLGAFKAENAEPVVQGISSVQGAVDTVHRAVPGMRVAMIVYPNRRWVSPNHYLLWAWGSTALTSKLRVGALVDARSGALATAAPLPWYMRMLDLARPLHFGDYGGVPLKILWALFDLALIVVLWSGVYLWLSHRKRPFEQKLDEMLRAEEAQKGVTG